MPGGQVGDPHGRVGLVHVLAAGPARPVRVDAELALVELELGVVGQERRGDDLRERRVAAMGLVERREAHEPVLPPLGLEDPVCVLASDADGRRLQARLLPGRRLQQLGLETAVGRPAQIHAEQHFGEVLGVDPARGRVQREERVARLVLAGEERLLLEPVELVAERPERTRDLVRHVAVEREQLARVLVLAGQLLVALEALAQPRVLGRNACRRGLVVPESRLPHPRLERGDAFPQRRGVKGNHGPRPTGSRSPRAAAPAERRRRSSLGQASAEAPGSRRTSRSATGAHRGARARGPGRSPRRAACHRRGRAARR